MGIEVGRGNWDVAESVDMEWGLGCSGGRGHGEGTECGEGAVGGEGRRECAEVTDICCLGESKC